MVTEIVISMIILFVGIIVLVIIHICVIGRAFGRHFEDGERMVEIISSRNEIPGMSDEDLKKLHCFDYEAGEKGNGTVDCVVCLENFNVGDKCRLLPNCQHSFHVKCIDSWLLKTPICPICRTCASSIQNICSFSDDNRNTRCDPLCFSSIIVTYPASLG